MKRAEGKALLGWACTLLFPCTWTRWAWTICSVASLPENWIWEASFASFFKRFFRPSSCMCYTWFGGKYEKATGYDHQTRESMSTIYPGPGGGWIWAWETIVFRKKILKVLKKETFSITALSNFLFSSSYYLGAFLLVLCQGWITLTAKSAGTHVWVMYACSYAYILMRNREAKPGRRGVFLSKLGEQPVSSDQWSSLLPLVSSEMACRWHIGAFFTNGCHIQSCSEYSLNETCSIYDEDISSWMNGWINKLILQAF